MNGIIKVDPKKLESTAGQFETSAGQIKSITSQMTTLVKSLNGAVWSGDAASAYTKKFDQLQDDINRIYKMVKEHADDLKEMARNYETSENKNVQAANSLSGDVVV